MLVNCKECNTPNSLINKYCFECGDMLRLEDSLCECGGRLSGYFKYCPNCSKEVVWGEQGSAKIGVVEPVTSSTQGHE